MRHTIYDRIIVTNFSLQTDFEISQGRVDSLMKKPKRSDRENANLAKAEAELANTKEVHIQIPNCGEITQSNDIAGVPSCRR